MAIHRPALPLRPVKPMLATLGLPPGGDDWAVEMKYDGIRAVATVTADSVNLFNRNCADITAEYSQIAVGLSDIDAGRGVVIDGEIVAAATGLAYCVFDLMAHRGAPILRWPYLERRQLLADAGLEGEVVHVAPYWVDVDGEAMLEVADEHGFDGIVAKRVTSPYLPGRRSPDWVKTTLLNSAEVIVGGWEATGRGGLRSLIVGAHRDGVGLVFVGEVGSGFSGADRRRTLALLRPFERPTSPFDSQVPDELARHARWVEPLLVGTVEYREFSPNRRLHRPSWRGFRAGIDPSWVTIEKLP
ncbi:DNA ligase [Rhodococcus oxybenzonivorans]|uniref:ATP-dependent DNA ligase n=1 Tax=Rhodococcus TaxID=1827 RepID=UPI00135A9564|nr:MULTISPECIES: DNA ligase [Rhodococcus]MDV7351679.1 DNA ligase [Rhodococcus oxybenzonivorans]